MKSMFENHDPRGTFLIHKYIIKYVQVQTWQSIHFLLAYILCRNNWNIIELFNYQYYLLHVFSGLRCSHKGLNVADSVTAELLTILDKYCQLHDVTWTLDSRTFWNGECEYEALPMLSGNRFEKRNHKCLRCWVISTQYGFAICLPRSFCNSFF